MDFNKDTDRLTKGEKTARRIFEAAAECIASLGIEKTSITEIAKRAKTSRGLVAHYCPKKDNLLQQVIFWIRSQAQAQIEADGVGGPKEKILYQMRANYEFFTAKPHYYMCYMLLYYYSGIREDFREINTAGNKHAVSRTHELLKQYYKDQGVAVSDEELRDTAHGLIVEGLGGMQTYFFSNHGLSKNEYIERHLRTMSRRIERLGLANK